MIIYVRYTNEHKTLAEYNVLKTVTLLPPLGDVDRLYNPRDFIDKGNGSCDVVQDGHISDLFPGHWHVLQQFQHCMGHVFEGTVQQKEKYGMSWAVVMNLLKQ